MVVKAVIFINKNKCLLERILVSDETILPFESG
jgi:hypothetical protein